eukprot:GHVT01086210.1.p1 GENE.GHVT01086210.1~~GHVT01086210.1.p1  ORF type:complete len:141 (+),score=4.90 GHVT01086210.1:308-730(+)
MSSVTVLPAQYPDLLYRPAPTGSSPPVGQLQHMRLDSTYFTRNYMICRGSGSSHEECRYIPCDTQITPRNTAEDVYRKEFVDAIECMSVHGSAEQCHHFFEGLHKEMHYHAPQPGTIAKCIKIAKKLVCGGTETVKTKTS